MKLLIILTLLSFVSCGINNSITVFNNDTIYLANTNNAAIYELTKNANETEYKKKVVIGNPSIKGNVSDYNGLEARLTNPRSIINTFNEKILFFIDDNKFIKSSIIDGNKSKGIELINIANIENSSLNIFENVANNYAAYKNNDYIFFVSSYNLHKINLKNNNDTSNDSVLINNISLKLDNGSNFINISYYNNSLFYCYKNSSNIYYLKKSNNEHYYNINDNSSLDINYQQYLSNIRGFTFIQHNTSNLLLVTGTSNNDTKICKFHYIDHNNITHIKSYHTNTKYSVLIDYKAIYGSDKLYNGTIIGRKYINSTNISTTNGFNIIKVINEQDTLNSETEQVFDMIRSVNIHINTTNSTSTPSNELSYNINTNIIYNNIINNNFIDNNYRIIHFNTNKSSINLINYSKYKFSTYKMLFTINDSKPFNNFDNFDNYIIQNITISQQNTLYIALYKIIDKNSKIYSCEIDNITNNSVLPSYSLTELNISIEGQILAMNCLINKVNNTDELHYITNESYNKYNINNNTNVILENIRKTNDTDALNNINDFIIDTDYEIGYIAFETRLKWFYY